MDSLHCCQYLSHCRCQQLSYILSDNFRVCHLPVLFFTSKLEKKKKEELPASPYCKCCHVRRKKGFQFFQLWNLVAHQSELSYPVRGYCVPGLTHMNWCLQNECWKSFQYQESYVEIHFIHLKLYFTRKTWKHVRF